MRAIKIKRLTQFFRPPKSITIIKLFVIREIAYSFETYKMRRENIFCTVVISSSQNIKYMYKIREEKT